MPREIANVRTGNHIRILLDGVTIGLMQNVQASDDYGVEPASGIGDIHVQEYYPTVARHSLSTSFVVMKTDLLIQKGFVPENGDQAMRGIVFDVEIYDKRTGQLLRKYINCTFGSGSVDINAHRALMRNAQFMALDVSGQV